ncbi:MAG: ion channel [Pseudomonadota bacterium]
MENKLTQHCQYTNRYGEKNCKHPPQLDGLCFWHNSESKENSDLTEKLHELAEQGHSLVGYQLKQANLKNLNLVHNNSRDGYDFSQADLYKSNLEHAHLFHINLSNASLMKANLSDANLHCANLEDCNLLGVNLTGAKIENVHWGKQILQERLADEAKKAGDIELMEDYLQQTEEIYRNIRKTAENQGLFETSGNFFYKEMVVRRFLLPKYSLNRTISWLVDIFCGYGEKPLNVVIISISFIAVCAIFYFFLGIESATGLLKLNLDACFKENMLMFFESLYFSVITFTTLGYGDLVPVGITRLIAASEAFTGNFTMALFVVVFVKKMTR